MGQHIAHYTPGLFSAKPKAGGMIQMEGLVETQNRFALRVRNGDVEVTHMPSGMITARRPDLYGAAIVVQRLLDECPLVNWTDPNPVFTTHEERCIRNIVAGEPNV